MPLHAAVDLLGQAGELFRTIWDSTTDAMTLSDADGIVLLANPAYRLLTGYSADEMVGKSAAVIFPPEARDWMIQHYRDLYAMETPPPAGELTIQHQDGTARFVEARVDFLTEGARRVAMISVLHDVTERRQAAELVEKLHALATGMASARQPSEIARLILAHCVSVLGAQAGAVNLISDDGTVLDLLESTGYPSDVVERWLSMPVAAPTFLSEAVRSAVPVFVGSIEALQTRYPGMIVSSVALGHHSWAALPLMGEHGPIGAIGVSFLQAHELSPDERALAVTLASQCAQALERARLEEGERRAHAATEAAIQARDELLGMIIHDLKNPLAAIQGFGQLLQRRATRGEPIAPQALADTAGHVESSARLLVAMLNDLLEASRVRANDAPPLDRRPTDLVALVRRVAEAQPRSGDGHRILIQSSANELVGSWDAARLERALNNLIGNAIKYSPDGGEVTVIVRAEGESAIVSITDQGVGIPATDLPRVFERFHRGANVVGQIDGWGIGLSSVRQIITQHGGTVGVESREGHGSTFTVRLPLIAGDGSLSNGRGRK